MVHERLREVRLQLGVRQNYIAGKLEKSPSWYHGIETGRRRLDVETLVAIADIIGVDVAVFFDKNVRITRSNSA